MLTQCMASRPRAKRDGSLSIGVADASREFVVCRPLADDNLNERRRGPFQCTVQRIRAVVAAKMAVIFAVDFANCYYIQCPTPLVESLANSRRRCEAWLSISCVPGAGRILQPRRGTVAIHHRCRPRPRSGTLARQFRPAKVRSPTPARRTPPPSPVDPGPEAPRTSSPVPSSAHISRGGPGGLPPSTTSGM